MRGTSQETRDRLRGALPKEEPGARGLEQVARNPKCKLRRALIIAGISPATAASEIYSEHPREGQSPFAIATGNSFEAHIFANGAEKLLDLYRQERRLSPLECKVVNVADHAPGTTPRDMARRKTLSRQLLEMKRRRDPAAPNVIIHPRLPVRLLGVDHPIEPDVLVAADIERFYRPVEVKSYPDRAGKTDPADTRNALRQAAVAVIALRQVLHRLGVADVEHLVPEVCDLVLRKPGSFGVTLSPMSVEGEVGSIRRMLEESPRDLKELQDLLQEISPEATLNDPEVLDAVENNYLPSCKEHCALTEHCKRRAVEEGNPILLGRRVREELASAGTLPRALELLHGRGAPPRNSEEAALQARLRESNVAFREVSGFGG